MTKRRQPTAWQTMFTAHAGVNPRHAFATVRCPRCKETSPMRGVFVCPDPLGNAQRTADALAQSWLASHPCRPTFVIARKEAA